MQYIVVRSRGQITLPTHVRNELGLRIGNKLYLVSKKGHLQLRCNDLEENDDSQVVTIRGKYQLTIPHQVCIDNNIVEDQIYEVSLENRTINLILFDKETIDVNLINTSQESKLGKDFGDSMEKLRKKSAIETKNRKATRDHQDKVTELLKNSKH